MKELLKLNYSHIWAVRHFMAKSDVRFYLCGILVDGENLVATDGHAMGICSMDHNEEFKQQYENGLIIPSYAINSLVRKLGKPTGIKRDREIDLIKVNDQFFVLTDNVDAHEYFSAVDGRYPDYKRVDMPKPTIVPKSAVLLDTKYLVKFNKVAEGISKSKPMIYFGEDDKKACYVEINENMHRSKDKLTFDPVSLQAKYKNRKTIVEYCLFTRLTIRVSQNGNVADVKKHNIIQFIDYVIDLFLGKKRNFINK